MRQQKLIDALFLFISEPAKVSNLKVTNITVSSLIVSWEILEGYYTGFDVNVSYATNT